MPSKKNRLRVIMRNASSVFLGVILLTAGMSKLYSEHAFPGLIGPVWLVEKLAEYNLGLFARFVAYSQILIGFLLITTRYRTLGAIMSVPMFINILMITVSLRWTGTPYVIIFLLGLNFYLLWGDREKFYPLIRGKSDKIISTVFWIAGLLLILVSPTLSHWNIKLSYTAVIAGLFFSFIAQNPIFSRLNKIK